MTQVAAVNFDAHCRYRVPRLRGLILPGVGSSILSGGLRGAIAQLGERCLRKAEVGDSISPGSTSIPDFEIAA